MKKFISVVIVIIGLAVLCGCDVSDPKTKSTTQADTYASELLVFAATGTKAPMDAAAAAFEEKYGTKIVLNYGGGGEVLSNMILSKQGDVYVSPEQRFMNSAKQQGAVGIDTAPSSLAYMIPVLAVQKGNPLNIQNLADLSASGVKIAIGNPDTTLLGEAAPEILQKAGLYESVKGNIVANVPQVNAIVTYLKTKQIDAGFAWHYFGVTNPDDIDIIWIPAEYVTAIGELQAAVATYSKEAWTAQQFIKFLSSSDGQAIFKQYGYIVDQTEANQYRKGN
ncbi:MAG: molybdate ABC transporter substrate-binding protein [Dehalococcoidales bacterium]